MEFFLTAMGHRFYEVTMPGLVEQLKRLNDNLERRMAREDEKLEEAQRFINELNKEKS